MEQQEKLVPFDYDQFAAEPTRLRYYAPSDALIWAEPVRGNVIVQWTGAPNPLVYTPATFSCLRLAAKTRVVKLRLYRSTGIILAATDSDVALVELNRPDCEGDPWVSDIIEVEVTE